MIKTYYKSFEAVFVETRNNYKRLQYGIFLKDRQKKIAVFGKNYAIALITSRK